MDLELVRSGWQQMEYAVVYDPQIERCLGWYVRKMVIRKNRGLYT